MIDFNMKKKMMSVQLSSCGLSSVKWWNYSSYANVFKFIKQNQTTTKTKHTKLRIVFDKLGKFQWQMKTLNLSIIGDYDVALDSK